MSFKLDGVTWTPKTTVEHADLIIDKINVNFFMLVKIGYKLNNKLVCLLYLKLLKWFKITIQF